VHHAAIFLVPAEHRDLPFAWAAEDERPGYRCFGGPTGDRGAQFPIQQLGAWLPGQDGLVYPDGIGIRVEPGAVLVVQMHYYTPAGVPEPDASEVAFRVEDQVTAPALHAPFLDLGWVVGGLEIPAGAATVEHQLVDDPRGFFRLVLGEAADLPRGFRIHAITHHMHRLGRSGRLERVRGRGSTALLNIPRWDFDWQRQYVLETPVEVRPGDRLRLTCVYGNGPGDQPPGPDGRPLAPVDVNWGEGSDDEMCVANLLITPL
jgi:hypothetical protein